MTRRSKEDKHFENKNEFQMYQYNYKVTWGFMTVVGDRFHFAKWLKNENKAKVVVIVGRMKEKTTHGPLTKAL